MRRLWNRLRNGTAFWSAYRDVNTLTGDDLAHEQIFVSLREFAAAPSEPEAIPVELLREFSAAQKRRRGRRKFRFGAGALFATVILIPGLAYAGALPISVAKVVQRIFNVVSVPIQIPSVAAQSAKRGQTVPSSVQPTSDTSTQTPETSSTETSSQVASLDNPNSLLPQITISTESTDQTPTGDGTSSQSEPSNGGGLGTGTVPSEVMSENGGLGDLTPSDSPTPSADLVITPDPDPTPSDSSE